MKNGGSYLRTIALVLLCALTATACASTTTAVILDDTANPDTAETASAVASEESDEESTETDSEPTRENAPAPTEAAPPGSLLAEVALGTASAEELDRIAIFGLPADTVAEEVTVFYVDGDTGIGVDVASDADGHYFIAPLHPELPGEGGALDLFVVVDQSVSQQLRVELSGLPPAPGATLELLATSRERAEAHAESVGTSLDDLRQIEIADVAPGHLVAKTMQLLLDEGLTGEASRTLADDVSALSATELDLVDAVLAKLITTPPGPDGSTPPPPPPPLPAGPPAPTADGAPTDATAPIGGGSVSAAAGSDADCISDPPFIDSPERLERALEIGTRAAERVTGTSGTVRQVVQTVLGLAPSPVAVAGSVVAFNTLFETIDAARYPNRLSNLNPTLSTTEFNEDFEEAGSWGATTITASSPGGSVLQEFAGAISSLGGQTVAASELLTATREQRLEAVLSPVDGLESFSLTENNLGSRLEEQGVRLNYCPHDWTVKLAPAGSNETMAYLVVTATGDGKVNEAEQTFRPTELGAFKLSFVLRSEEFAKIELSHEVEITTKETSVVLQPAAPLMVDAPGDVIELDLSFVNSDSEAASWGLDGGSFIDGFGLESGPGTRTIQTAQSESAFPMLVSAQLDTTNGLFADSREQPSASVEIRLAELIIAPKDAVVQVGGSVQYTATNQEGEAVEVLWQAGGGTIDEDGLYVAGDDPGTYPVTATLITDVTVRATTKVTITDPTCIQGTWTLRLDEMAQQLEAATPGATFLFIEGEYTVTIFEDYTWSAERSELTFEMIAQGQEARMIITSVESGTVIADDTNIAITETSSDGEAFIELPGIGRIGGEFPSGAGFGGSGTYTCERPIFTVSADGFTATLDYLGPPPAQ